MWRDVRSWLLCIGLVGSFGFVLHDLTTHAQTITKSLPWTASVLKSGYTDDAKVQVVVQYSNGQTTIFQDYRFDGSATQSGLQSAVDAQLDKLNGVANASLPTPGPIPRSSVPVEDPAAASLSKAIAHLVSAQHAVDLGVITKADKEYTDAIAAVKAQYDAKYLDFF